MKKFAPKLLPLLKTIFTVITVEITVSPQNDWLAKMQKNARGKLATDGGGSRERFNGAKIRN